MNINVTPEYLVTDVDVRAVLVDSARRQLNIKTVATLRESIDHIGLQTPITVRDIGCGEYRLIAGRHRLEAFRLGGHKTIPAVIRDCNEVEAELWEIAENLHRAELTVLERDEQVARWIELTERSQKVQLSARLPIKNVEDKLAQVEPVYKGGRGNEGGIRAAARELGIDRNDAHRAAKVASLSPEAKETARDLKLDDTRSVLLEAAKHTNPVDQVASLQSHVRGTFGTGENEWYTPKEHLEAARAVLGEFDLDPASSELAQRQIQAGTFYSKEDSGLNHEWHGRVWLNPPYAQPFISEFVTKMVNERKSGRVSEAIMLTHNYTDTTWFHNAASTADAICFTRGRVRFVSPEGALAAPTQGQAFFYFGSKIKEFADTFRTIGFVVEVKR